MTASKASESCRCRSSSPPSAALAHCCCSYGQSSAGSNSLRSPTGTTKGYTGCPPGAATAIYVNQEQRAGTIIAAWGVSVRLLAAEQLAPARAGQRWRSDFPARPAQLDRGGPSL
jgi:hypothetical protein